MQQALASQSSGVGSNMYGADVRSAALSGWMREEADALLVARRRRARREWKTVRGHANRRLLVAHSTRVGSGARARRAIRRGQRMVHSRTAAWVLDQRLGSRGRVQHVKGKRDGCREATGGGASAARERHWRLLVVNVQ
eukprot:6202572-Pleurochrysis_carterae.AAC.2